MDYDVKKALKDAKEFIKNKDFTSALESCKVQEIFFRIPYISPTLTPSLTSLGNIEAR